MKKIRTIIDSYFALLAYNCLLKEGNWCSSKKEIKLSFKNRKPKSIKGCGCWLFAKWFSVLNEVNKCPLNQWENFE